MKKYLACGVVHSRNQSGVNTGYVGGEKIMGDQFVAAFVMLPTVFGG